jgi:hypothetical protein
MLICTGKATKTVAAQQSIVKSEKQKQSIIFWVLILWFMGKGTPLIKSSAAT